MQSEDGEFFAIGFIWVLLSSVFWMLIMLFTNNSARQGYFYVSSGYNGAVLKMDNSEGDSTVITGPMPIDEATKLCNEYNKQLGQHANK